MARAMISPKFYAWDRNGKPLAFGKVYTYQARTNTPKPTYHSEDQIVPNTNPVILSGEGYADIYLDGSYKIVVKDSNDNEIWTADPVTQGGGGGSDTYSQFTLTGYYSTPTKVEVLGDYTSAMREGVRITLTTLQDSGRDKEQPSTIVSSSFDGDKTAITITDPIVTPGVKSVSVTNWPFEEIGAIEEFVESNELTFQTPQGKTKETITGIERKVFNQIAPVPLGDGQWAAGKVYTAYNEYLNYGGIAYKPAMDTPLPYTTQGSSPADGPDEGLVIPFAEVTRSDVVLNVSSISELLNVQPTGDGFKVNVTAYHDGLAAMNETPKGGGVFVWGFGRHNGGTFIDPERPLPEDWNNATELNTWFSDSGSDAWGWARQYNGAVSVLWFGAKGDGSTDDTEAFSKAVATGNSVSIPVGDYFAEDHTRFSLVSGQRVSGEGRGTTVLLNMGFSISNADHSVDDCTIENMTIRPNGIYRYGIVVKHSSRCTLRDLTISHCYDGILFYSPDSLTTLKPSEDNLIENVYVEKAARIGLTLDLNTYKTKVINCHVDDSKQGFHLERVEDIAMRDCIATNCGLGATYTVPTDEQPDSYAGSLLLTSSKRVIIDGFRHLSPKGGNRIKLQTGHQEDITFVNCHLNRVHHMDGVVKNLTMKNSRYIGYYGNNSAKVEGVFNFINNNEEYSIEDIPNITELILLSTDALDSMNVVNSCVRRIKAGSTKTNSRFIAKNVKTNPGDWWAVRFDTVIIDGLHQYLTNSGSGYPYYVGLRLNLGTINNLTIRNFITDGTTDGAHLIFLNPKELEYGLIEPIVGRRSYWVETGGSSYAEMNIRTQTSEWRASSSPTKGTWKSGDIVWNSSPSAAGTPGWVCTDSGTPGTWKAMANLSD